MPRYCSECTFLNPEKAYYDGTFWCDKMLECHYADDLECYRFCEAYSRPASKAKSLYEFSRSKQQKSDCYITTILCNILHMDDQNEYLNTLRVFRDSVLQNNLRYVNILASYDIIGPQIAKCLFLDKERDVLAQLLFTNYIIPIVSYIKKKENKKAVDRYVIMTEELAQKYHISYRITFEDEQNMDLSSAGHGIYKPKILFQGNC